MRQIYTDSLNQPTVAGSRMQPLDRGAGAAFMPGSGLVAGGRQTRREGSIV
jgi:hypothetical protein